MILTAEIPEALEERTAVTPGVPLIALSIRHLQKLGFHLDRIMV